MSTDLTSIGNFIVKELVGQGSFSEVYNCVLPECGNIYFAIKRLLSTCSSKKIVNEVTSLFLLKVLIPFFINYRTVLIPFLFLVSQCRRIVWILSFHMLNQMTLHCSFVIAPSKMFLFPCVLMYRCRITWEICFQGCNKSIQKASFIEISNPEIFCKRIFYAEWCSRYSRESGFGVLIDFGLAEVKEGLVEEMLNNLRTKQSDAQHEEEVVLFS